MEQICRAFDVTMCQLFAADDEPVALTPEQRQLLDKWSCLTQPQQMALLQLLDVF